jgi:hypothetical protein
MRDANNNIFLTLKNYTSQLIFLLFAIKPYYLKNSYPTDLLSLIIIRNNN